MPLNITIRPEAAAEAKAAIFEGTKEVFEVIKASAKEHANFGKYATGATAESIDIKVEPTHYGIHAEIFTQSGHGGYVEMGTKHMKAEPFLQPAFDENIGKLPEAVKARLIGG